MFSRLWMEQHPPSCAGVRSETVLGVGCPPLLGRSCIRRSCSEWRSLPPLFPFTPHPPVPPRFLVTPTILLLLLPRLRPLSLSFPFSLRLHLPTSRRMPPYHHLSCCIRLPESTVRTPPTRKRHHKADKVLKVPTLLLLPFAPSPPPWQPYGKRKSA